MADLARLTIALLAVLAPGLAAEAMADDAETKLVQDIERLGGKVIRGSKSGKSDISIFLSRTESVSGATGVRTRD